MLRELVVEGALPFFLHLEPLLEALPGHVLSWRFHRRR
jgi:hypothetical protein